MIIVDSTDFLKIMAYSGHEVFTEKSGQPFNLNIVGWRNKFGKADTFCDMLSVYWQVSGHWLCRHYPITSRPGVPSLLSPKNPKGTAILVPGQYIGAYKLGLHKGKYRALVQADIVHVYRDRTLDPRFDEALTTIEKGMFGINIHKAGVASRFVGVSSEGCQVFQNSDDFEEFLNICDAAKEVWGNKFTYTLVAI